MDSDKDREENRAAGPDLGLADLVRELEQSDEAAEQQELTPQIILEEDPSEDQDLNSPDSYDHLYQKELFAELIRVTELRLETEPDLEARIWWLRGQLAIGAVPLLVLTGPLDESWNAFQQLPAEEQDALRSLIGKMLLETTERLRGAGDLELALEIGLRAEKFAPESRSLLAQIVDQRIAELCSDQKQRLLSQDRIQQLEDLRRRLTEDLRVDRMLGFVSEPSSGESRALDTAEGAVDTAEERVRQRALFMPGKSLGNSIAKATLVVGSVALGWYYFQSVPVEFSGSGEIDISASEPALALPVVRYAQGMNELDAILYGVGDAQPDQRRRAQNGAAKSETATQHQGQEERRAPRREAATVDTAGPLEPERVRLAVLGEPAGEADDTSDSGVVDVKGHFKRTPKSASSAQERFVKFSSSILYRVVVDRSDVYASADLRSSRVAGLREGDQVLVEGRVKNWLRLRSKRGNIGYVLIQDVEPVSEFSG